MKHNSHDFPDPSRPTADQQPLLPLPGLDAPPARRRRPASRNSSLRAELRIARKRISLLRQAVAILRAELARVTRGAGRRAAA